MIVPIASPTSGERVALRDAAFDVYETERAYVLDVHMRHAGERRLRLDVGERSIAVIADEDTPVVELALRCAVDTSRIATLLGPETLSIEVPKRSRSACGGGAPLVCVR